jgi:hypothetical protein
MWQGEEEGPSCDVGHQHTSGDAPPPTEFGAGGPAELSPLEAWELGVCPSSSHGGL